MQEDRGDAANDGAMNPFDHFRNTPTMESPMGNDMMAVARRIRERARVLQDEQRKAEAIRCALLDLHQTREIEIATNNRQRRCFLQSTNERNAVELELFAVQESIEDCRKRARAMDQETLESEERIRKLTDQRLQQTKSFYGPNIAKMDTYTKVLETIVESKQKAMEARQKRFEELRAQLKDSKEREECLLRETKEIQGTIDHGEQIDRRSRVGDGTDADEQSKGEKQQSVIGREDLEITALSNKVREAITTVSDI